jgi:hypothetical protein
MGSCRIDLETQSAVPMKHSQFHQIGVVGNVQFLHQPDLVGADGFGALTDVQVSRVTPRVL